MPLDISALKQAFENVKFPEKDGKTLSSRLSEIKDNASLNEYYDDWKKFYKSQARELHPDKIGGDGNEFKKFQENAEQITKYFDQYTQASGIAREFKDDNAKNDFLDIAIEINAPVPVNAPVGKEARFRSDKNSNQYSQNSNQYSQNSPNGGFNSTREDFSGAPSQEKPVEKPIYESAKTDFFTSSEENMQFIEVLRRFFNDQRTKNEEFFNQNKNSNFPKNEYKQSNFFESFFESITPDDKLTSTFIKWHDPDGRSAFAIEFKILDPKDQSISSSFSFMYTDNISLDEFKNISKSHINTNDIANEKGLKFTSFSKLVKNELGVNGEGR